MHLSFIFFNTHVHTYILFLLGFPLYFFESVYIRLFISIFLPSFTYPEDYSSVFSIWVFTITLMPPKIDRVDMGLPSRCLPNVRFSVSVRKKDRDKISGGGIRTADLSSEINPSDHRAPPIFSCLVPSLIFSST